MRRKKRSCRRSILEGVKIVPIYSNYFVKKSRRRKSERQYNLVHCKSRKGKRRRCSTPQQRSFIKDCNKRPSTSNSITFRTEQRKLKLLKRPFFKRHLKFQVKNKYFHEDCNRPRKDHYHTEEEKIIKKLIDEIKNKYVNKRTAHIQKEEMSVEVSIRDTFDENEITRNNIKTLQEELKEINLRRVQILNKIEMLKTELL